MDGGLDKNLNSIKNNNIRYKTKNSFLMYVWIQLKKSSTCSIRLADCFQPPMTNLRCHPTDLWSPNKTSSRYVKIFAAPFNLLQLSCGLDEDFVIIIGKWKKIKTLFSLHLNRGWKLMRTLVMKSDKIVGFWSSLDKWTHIPNEDKGKKLWRKIKIMHMSCFGNRITLL